MSSADAGRRYEVQKMRNKKGKGTPLILKSRQLEKLLVQLQCYNGCKLIQNEKKNY